MLPRLSEVKMERPAAFTPVKDLGGSLDVAVLLPFYLRENTIRIEIDSSKAPKGKKNMIVPGRMTTGYFRGAWISLKCMEAYFLQQIHSVPWA